MRIGLITGEYPPMQGGIADYSRLLARALVAQGHSLFVLTHPQGGGMAEAGINVDAHIDNWNRALWQQVAAWAGRHRLDIINLQYQTAAFRMAAGVHLLPLRLRAHCPFVTTFHDLRFPYLFPKAGPLRPWIVRLLARLSDGVICTSPQDAASLRQTVQPALLAQIPIGANVGFYPPAPDGRARLRKTLGVADSTLLLAHFGFINHSKGLDTLLHAAAQMQAQAPVHLLMIGGQTGASDPSNQAYLREIEGLAARLGLPLHWTGFVADTALGDYFAAADVVALPFRDGASLRRGSLLGALAQGAAVVSTQPAPDETLPLAPGRDLLLVPPDDPAALAAALLALARDPAQRQALATHAKAAVQPFAWPQIAAQCAAFYEQVRGQA